MKYTKEDIQKRVLQSGNPLPLSEFSWDENTNTFISNEDNLVIDFWDVDFSTVTTGHHSTVKTGHYSTVTTGAHSTVNTGDYATVTTGGYATVTTGNSSTVTTGYRSTVTTEGYATVTTGGYSTVKTGDYSTVKTRYKSTVTTDDYSTVTAGGNSTVKTGNSSTVTTEGSSTVKTGNRSTVTTGGSSTITTEEQCCLHYINSYGISIVMLMDDNTVKTFNSHILIQEKDSGKFILNGEWYDIFDGILSKIITKKGNVYKVMNDGETEESYVVTDGENFAHGQTISDAKNDLIFKISKRDTSAFKGLTLDSIVDFEIAVKAYRSITGSCESMTKDFALANKKDSYTIQELIDLTEGQFNHNLFKEFFNR